MTVGFHAWLLVVTALCASPARFLWPDVAVISAVEVPGPLKSEGVPVKLRALVVRGTPEQLLRTYAGAFEQSGLYVLPQQEQARLTSRPSLTALDVERKESYSVFLEPREDGTTTVILGEAALSQRDLREPSDFAPLFPGATGVVRSDQEGARLIAFRAKAKGEQVLAFYVGAFAQTGFKEVPGDDPSSALYSNGAREIGVRASTGKGGSCSVLLVERGR